MGSRLMQAGQYLMLIWYRLLQILQFQVLWSGGIVSWLTTGREQQQAEVAVLVVLRCVLVFCRCEFRMVQTGLPGCCLALSLGRVDSFVFLVAQWLEYRWLSRLACLLG